MQLSRSKPITRLIGLVVIASIWFCFSVPTFFADEPVIWTNVIGASASGNTLTKTAADGSWNSGAVSTQVVRDGYGYMEFSADQANTELMAGLSFGDTNQDWTDPDFGINLDMYGILRIYEAGTHRGNFGTYASGDHFRVEVRYGVVRYLRNGSVFYASGVVPRYPLRVDTAFYKIGATLTNVRIGNLVWTDAAGVSIAGQSLTKTGAAGWTSGAASTNTIESGDGFVQFTATETDKNRAAGLGNGNTDAGLADIDFGIVLRSDGYVEVSESGTSRGTFAAYLSGDVFRVEVSGGTVRYYQNGVTFYTSSITPTFPLRADASLDSVGATITDVSLETLLWSSTTGVSIQGATLAKTASGGSWNASASSSNSIGSGDGWVEFTAVETNMRRAGGLKATGAAQSYTDIDFAIDLKDTGIVEIFELGTSRGQYGSYANGDRFRVEIQEGVVRYRKNGTVLYSSSATPTYPLHMESTFYSQGATLADVAVGEFVWINEAGVKPLGSSITKSATSTGWDAGAVSTKAISSGYFEFSAWDTSTYRIAGLSKGDSNQDYTDIDYAIVVRPGTSIGIYEAGTNRGNVGTYAAGDRFRVEVLNNIVKYYKNGTLLYTSGVVPSTPLRADVSLADPNAVLFNPILYGEPVTDQLDLPTITPAGGVYTSTVSATITHPEAGVTLRYTTDGTDPSVTSPVYTAAIVIDQPTTVKAKAWKSAYTPSLVRTAVYTMKAATPSFSEGSGTYNTARSITISSSAGATIRYTTDGSTPTGSSPLYTGPVSVDQPLTLKAIASKAGWLDSDVASATYVMKVGALSLSPPPGSYSGVQTVTLTTATPNVTFRYTTDGSSPTSASVAASGNTITIDRSMALQVQAFRTGWSASDIASGNYFINLGVVGTPTLSPAAGTYSTAKNVPIANTTPGAVIRYTTDGTEPTIRSRIYTDVLLVNTTTQVRAKAFKTDMTASATATGLYVIDTGVVDTPRFSPGSGTYPAFQTVTITTETPGATIHYTTNGAEPAESDPVIASGGTVTVNQSMTLKAKAWKTGLAASNSGRADYWITGAIAAGEAFSLAVKPDGTVWSWGSNSSGQLGRGGASSTPSAVSITDVVAVAGGSAHALALKRDGTVWAWGNGGNGRLGNGSTATQWSPVQVTGLSDVIGIAAGSAQSIAVKRDGSVWIWGADELSSYGAVPVQKAGLSGITQVAASDWSSFALKTDGDLAGTVWAWGKNQCGQLGDGTVSHRANPALVAGLTNVTIIAAGWEHTVAAKSDGTVWGWGCNQSGQLGEGISSNIHTTPVQSGLSYPNRITSIGAGRFTIALQHPRSGPAVVWTWGPNTDGQLGNGNSSTATTPVRNLVTDAVVVAAGIGSDSHHGLAISLDGRLWAWGRNDWGQLGDGTTQTRSTPAAVAGFGPVTPVSQTDDPDNDGIPTWKEMEMGTDPWNSDSNGDGVSDGIASNTGTSATRLDIDSDGLTNAAEISAGSDPYRADSDEDAVADGADCFPLDASRTQCPSSVPGDVTPPVINLTEPTNAVLTSTNP
jgi:alpha-tubulin suppressor-like RCC1 family protein